MRRILTIFDYSHNPPLPLRSLIVDDKAYFLTFYEKDTNLKLSDIKENIEKFKILLKTPCCINDFKAHLAGLKLDRRIDYTVYDLGLPEIRHGNNKQILIDLAKKIEDKSEPWQKLLGDTAIIYQYLEDKMMYCNGRIIPYHFNMNTFTGRSKTLGWNVQGATNEFNIRPSDRRDDIFIHFDWVSADIRMASFISGDPRMEESFLQSDPYQYVANFLNDPDFNRDKCKIELLKGIYSLSFTSPIFDMFPIFRQRMMALKHEIEVNKYSISILGRKFYLTDDNMLSVFNAQFQGSVAQAMQSALCKIFIRYPDNIFTEIHDSVVMCCNKDSAKTIIEYVSAVMIDPLSGSMKKSPRMPLKISVGRSWKNWELLRECR